MLTNGALVRLCRARDMLRETHDRRSRSKRWRGTRPVSPFHFIRQFQAMFGETPHQFRIQARLDRAKQLLAVSDYSVTDVCMEVGFTSLGSFSDLFARRVECRPRSTGDRVRSIMPARRVLPRELIPAA